MAGPKVTHEIVADYRGATDGYRVVKTAMNETEREAKAHAKEQARLTKQSAKDSEAAWKAGKDAQKQALSEGRKEMGAAAKDYNSQVGGMSSKWGALAVRAGGAIAGMMSIRALAGVLQTIQDRFDGIADSADNTAKALRAVAVQTAGKEGPGFSRDAMILGAKAGLSPEDTGQLANTIKSIQGADFKKEFATGAQLSNLGVKGEDAAPIIQAGVVRGMGGQRAAELALTASDLAPWSVGDVARVVPKTLGYSSLESGLAAGATLRTAGIPIEQMPASVEALGRVLTKDATPLSKKFKLAGLTESERIKKLSEAADASGDRSEFIRKMPEKYKLGEEESRALRAAMSVGGDFYAQQEATLRGTQTGEMGRRFESIMQDPIQKREFEARKAGAVLRAAQEYGPMGAAAEEERARKQATGARLIQEMPPEVAAIMTDESGKANLGGRAWSVLQKAGGGSGLTGAALNLPMPGGGGQLGLELGREFLPSVFGRDENAGKNEAARNEQVERLITALEKNTAAKEANTTTTGGDSGAPSRKPDRNAGL